jgi:glutathionyl-hydroquinone reductase
MKASDKAIADAATAAAGAYHLYVGHDCPWSQRCVLALALRGVSKASIGIDYCSPVQKELAAAVNADGTGGSVGFVGGATVSL